MLKWVENAILSVSPKWAAERAFYRVAHQECLSYDAAGRTRHTSGWATSGNSANAEFGVNGYDLDTVIQRSRDLARNTPYAARAVSVLASSIVGTGIAPRLNTTDKAAKKAAKNEWDAFSENCDPEGLMDFYGLQMQVARCMVESGEALIRWIPRPLKDYAFPLQCQVLEPDYIDKTKNGELNNGGYILQGVEFDATGMRVAYWMFDRHPGEMSRWGKKNPSKRVSADFISPCFFPLRPGQTHGAPWFAPIALRAKDINDYDETEVRRKKIETAIAAFVTRAGGTAGSVFGKSDKESDGTKKEKVRQGTIAYLNAGEDVKLGQPTHVQGYSEYMDVQLHALAAGCGCTYEQMTGNLRNTNYSSARVGLIEFYKLVDACQWLVVKPMLLAPAWRKFQAARQVLHGDAGQGSAIWAMPARPWVDPEKEQNANRAAVRNGIMTLPDVIAAQGEDPDEVLENIAATNARLDELGLILDTDPRRVAVGGASQVQNADSNAAQQGDNANA